ncbi:MAG TPA: phosphatase PAP2 family protein [Myxococcaceae bacterium]|jgi:membrane-associated phospholipid phosphatase
MLHVLAATVAISLAQAPPSIHELRSNWAVDGAVTGGGFALYTVSELALKPFLVPSGCRWCDRAADGSDALNPLDAGARAAVVWSPAGQSQANALSNVGLFLAMPIAMYGMDGYLAGSSGALGGWGKDALIISETTILAMLLNQGVKFIARRERPFVHVLPDAQKPLTENPNDNNLSFYSGHATAAFALLFSTLSVAELRGYPQRWLLWAVGAPLALATTYLRMAADRHYLTDCLAGAVVGGAVGWFLPILLHPREDAAPAGTQPQALRVSMGPSMVSVAVAFP